MEAIELNEQEKKATTERIKSFFDEIEIYITNIEKSKLILPLAPINKIRNLFKPLNKKKSNDIFEIYKSDDIFSIISELAISKLSYDNLNEKIRNKEKDDKLKLFIFAGYLSQLLSEPELYELAESILSRIINPETYYALILLPKVEIDDSLKINGSCFLIKSQADIISNFWINDNEYESNKDAITIEKNKSYLLIKQAGYIFRGLFRGKPLSIDLIERKAKVILGLSLAQAILELSSKGLPFLEREKPQGDIVLFDRIRYDEYDDEGVKIGPREANGFLDDELREYKSGEYVFRYLEKYRLPEDYADLINLLSISKSDTEPHHKFKRIGGADIEKVPKSEKDRSPMDILKDKFNVITNILDSDDEYAEAIKAASEWYFEGASTENETFKLVKYVIALESLLGDPKKEDRIKDRLSDRCAYLLGISQKERAKVKETFEAIYEIRSKIIHRRRTRLEEEDIQLLKEAKKLLEKVITKEIQLYNQTSSHKVGSDSNDK
ncbi:MAG: hypothetical protein DRG87_09815 [Deltaproteobacteria bacterium]|nr:MAG: hypothetical protein DRG87_09815 [Deltaproteobacteria bacterium]